MKKILVLISIAVFVLSACSKSEENAKASKSEIKKALVEKIDKSDQFPTDADKETAKTLIDCIIDGTYSKLSADSANALVDENTKFESLDDFPKEDKDLVTKVATGCYTKTLGS